MQQWQIRRQRDQGTFLAMEIIFSVLLIAACCGELGVYLRTPPEIIEY